MIIRIMLAMHALISSSDHPFSHNRTKYSQQPSSKHRHQPPLLLPRQLQIPNTNNRNNQNCKIRDGIEHRRNQLRRVLIDTLPGYKRVPDFHPRGTLPNLHERSCDVEEEVGPKDDVEGDADGFAGGEDAEELEDYG